MREDDPKGRFAVSIFGYGRLVYPPTAWRVCVKTTGGSSVLGAETRSRSVLTVIEGRFIAVENVLRPPVSRLGKRPVQGTVRALVGAEIRPSDRLVTTVARMVASKK